MRSSPGAAICDVCNKPVGALHAPLPRHPRCAVLGVQRRARRDEAPLAVGARVQHVPTDRRRAVEDIRWTGTVTGVLPTRVAVRRDDDARIVFVARDCLLHLEGRP